MLIVISKNNIAVDKPEWCSSAEDIWVSLTLQFPHSKRNIKLNVFTVYLCTENMGASFSDQVDNFVSTTLKLLISAYSNDKFLNIGDFNIGSIIWFNTSTGSKSCGAKGELVQYFIET
ncbi:unnamed protein product [Parnassius apollo]|uniref:(apollo) hypothetical protein n=1 Tax=Parnassius apollo TaxID=110799 RepID=A0A8S3Y624_PARAO|nr:unnamed protein product [Parnassius apollo]